MTTTWTTGTGDLSPPATTMNIVGYEAQITAAARALDKSGGAVQNEQFAVSTRTIIVNTNQAILTGLAYTADVMIVTNSAYTVDTVKSHRWSLARDGIRTGPAPAQVATRMLLMTTAIADATSSGPGDKSTTLYRPLA